MAGLSVLQVEFKAKPYDSSSPHCRMPKMKLESYGYRLCKLHVLDKTIENLRRGPDAFEYERDLSEKRRNCD